MVGGCIQLEKRSGQGVPQLVGSGWWCVLKCDGLTRCAWTTGSRPRFRTLARDRLAAGVCVGGGLAEMDGKPGRTSCLLGARGGLGLQGYS